MGNTPSEPGQPTSPKCKLCGKAMVVISQEMPGGWMAVWRFSCPDQWQRMHRRDHVRPLGALEEPCARCDVSQTALPPDDLTASGSTITNPDTK